ncbi:MAG: glycosyltransferase involved in cell wall biosynthesis [Phenylobacterium sp.]|jgi:glycosyltransferase involved in cell wall biosynthesis
MNANTTVKLSVCMIVRDEQTVLARCLDSIAGIYDELCIVDTGSTDNTVTIAQQYTNQVKVFTDCNAQQGQDQGKMVNFAQARNEALSMASGDWVLQIDADEIIEQGIERIREHLGATEYDRVGISIRTGTSNTNKAGVVSGRLFRRANAQQYVSLIHEYLEFDGKMEVDKHIRITNLPDKRNKESGSDRNIRLCRLMLDSDPQNSRCWYYLGREYFGLSKHPEAIDCFEKAQQYQRFTYANFHIAYSKAICLFLSRQFEQAVTAANEAMHFDPRFAEAYCLLGDIYFTIGDPEQAKVNYHKALACEPPQDTYLGVQLWAYQQHPTKQLAALD